MYFNAFMDELAKRHGLHKSIKGSVVNMSIVLGGGTTVDVVYDALDPTTRAYIRSTNFFPPITKEGRARFMNYILEFNRNALSLLPMGIEPHPKTDHAFTPTWYVQKQDFEFADWNRALDTYERLVKHASGDIEKMMYEWTSSIH